MRVRGDNQPSAAFTVEAIPNRPGMCLVRFFANAVHFDESGWEYDEYHLELPDTGGLQGDIEGNFDVYFDQAKRGDPDYTDPDTLAKREIEAALLTSQINTIDVDDNTALRWRKYYPTWESLVGTRVEKEGLKCQYKDQLYKSMQAPFDVIVTHTPDISASLWTKIDETHAGTVDDPIPYSGNMALENGKYYSQDGVTYYCNRDTGIPVYNALSELVGLYVVRVDP